MSRRRTLSKLAHLRSAGEGNEAFLRRAALGEGEPRCSILDLPPRGVEEADGGLDLGCDEDDSCLDLQAGTVVIQGVHLDAELDHLGADLAAGWQFEKDAVVAARAAPYPQGEGEGDEGVALDGNDAATPPPPTSPGGRAIPGIFLTPRLLAQRPQPPRAIRAG